ncbi:acyl carrier protein [Aquibium sp. ELW1220]|uniref:acyl carrier protein n=1 Tax=Aquibium sp. ELW1220 TaxID=2976766 RepID=UPI0025B1D906|nr:acyl carrier protein [Aquibium sp. ELW1220]MDN2582456.1 acyl carrier protein [Aquibium sp. ELW1220]
MGIPADQARAIVVAAIHDVTGLPPLRIAPDRKLVEDLGLDPLDFLRVVQLVEEHADIRLDDTTVAGVVTVDDLARLLLSP